MTVKVGSEEHTISCYTGAALSTHLEIGFVQNDPLGSLVNNNLPPLFLRGGTEGRSVFLRTGSIHTRRWSGKSAALGLDRRAVSGGGDALGLEHHALCVDELRTSIEMGSSNNGALFGCPLRQDLNSLSAP